MHYLYVVQALHFIYILAFDYLVAYTNRKGHQNFFPMDALLPALTVAREGSRKHWNKKQQRSENWSATSLIGLHAKCAASLLCPCCKSLVYQ